MTPKTTITIIIRHQDTPPWELRHSCALDIADAQLLLEAIARPSMTPKTTITITITIDAEAEAVLDNVGELSGGLAELRSAVERLAAESVSLANADLRHSLKFEASAEPADDAATSILARRLPKLGKF